MTVSDDTLLVKAVALAAQMHGEQKDKRGELYIFHPLRVMEAVRKDGHAKICQIVAVLHDIVEDTYCSLEQLEQVFDEEVVLAVGAITKKEGEVHWDYFMRCVKDPYARIVKYYDTLDNADPTRFHPGAPYSRYTRVLEWYFTYGVMVAPGPSPLTSSI